MENGIDIAITGMSVVFVALSLVTAAIASLPRVLAWLEPFLGPERDRHAPTGDAGPDESDVRAIVAAIGAALIREREREAD